MDQQETLRTHRHQDKNMQTVFFWNSLFKELGNYQSSIAPPDQDLGHYDLFQG
jgi:hypothetical protein